METECIVDAILKESIFEKVIDQIIQIEVLKKLKKHQEVSLG